MTNTINPKNISQPDLHRHLLSAVAPRPICFASTIDAAGNVNLSPFSFFNVFSSNPPIMIFSPARSARNNTTKHTYDNILAVKEVVINIVNFPIVEQMSLASTAYEKGVNEFIKAGLTPVASEKIKPPRVKESPVAFECVVENVIELGTEGGAGNLIIAKVELIHIQNKYLNDDGFLDTKKLDLVARMGESYYCHANGNALFEIPKPLRTKGIGVDQLPINIKNSTVFTGNDLGRLGNVEIFPNKDFIKKMEGEKEVKILLKKFKIHSEELALELHLLAKKYLSKGKTQEALAIAFLSNRK